MPVKPMLLRVYCLAKVITAHGFTGKALAVIVSYKPDRLR
jgi:hypothetical protein